MMNNDKWYTRYGQQSNFVRVWNVYRFIRWSCGYAIKRKKLPEKNKDHKLQEKFTDSRECHITPDLLLIYEIENDELLLYLTDTGTHSDLFG